MTGTRINEYGVGDVNLTALMECEDTQRRGKCDVSLTNYTTSTKPEVAEGSVLEVNGALFEFQADESVTGSPSNGTVYIKIVPSGGTCTAAFTNSAPTWDDERQGWYEAATNNRYLPFGMTKSGSNYNEKYQFGGRQAPDGIDFAGNGMINITGDSKINHDGTPVYGYMTDGTPLYTKEINITIAAGSFAESAAHGILNAVTNDRIVNIYHRTTAYAGFRTHAVCRSSLDQLALYRHRWNNTDLTLNRVSGEQTLTFICFIVYK